MKLFNKHPVLGLFLMIALFVFPVLIFKSTVNYFSRFPIDGFEEILTKNNVLLTDLEVDEIRFVTYNYSGNAAGRQATSLTVYVQSSLMDNKVYLRNESIKLNGIIAVLKDDKWIVYGTKSTKKFDKNEIKTLFEEALISFIEAKKKLRDNQLKWTQKQ